MNDGGYCRTAPGLLWFVKISLRRRHTPMVRNGGSSHKIDYITIVQENLNHEGHQNCITGSRVTAILLNGLIFPFVQRGEASPWRVRYQRGLPRLVYTCLAFYAALAAQLLSSSSTVLLHQGFTKTLMLQCYKVPVQFYRDNTVTVLQSSSLVLQGH